MADVVVVLAVLMSEAFTKLPECAPISFTHRGTASDGQPRSVLSRSHTFHLA